MLKEAGISQSRVGREMGMTPTSIGRYLDWLDEGSLNDDQWRDMAMALERLGISAENVKPVPPTTPKRLPTDLVPLLDLFTTRTQVEALIKVATGPEGARELLALMAAERLKFIK